MQFLQSTIPYNRFIITAQIQEIRKAILRTSNQTKNKIS